MAQHPVDFLRSVPLGTRVVVRTRIPGGLTDALGYLRERSALPGAEGADTVETCSIETRLSGLVTVALADVVAAKAVPEPPARRPRTLAE